MSAASVPSNTHSGAGDAHVSGVNRQSGSTGYSGRFEQSASCPKVRIDDWTFKLKNCKAACCDRHVMWPKKHCVHQTAKA